MRLLISGFEPFGGATVNPSALLTQAFRTDPPAGWHTEIAVLPVVYAEAWPALREAIARHDPDVVLATGLAGGRAGLAIERFAVNFDDGELPDNAGERRADLLILPDAPTAYASPLPVQAMAAAAAAAGVPARLSLSAGSFLCNHVFFQACHAAACCPERGRRCGFVHLPWLPEQAAMASPPGQPSLPLSAMVAGVRAALAAIGTTG